MMDLFTTKSKKDQKKDYKRNYYLLNRTECLEKQRKYYYLHRQEKLSYQKKYGELHKKEILNYHKKVFKAKPWIKTLSGIYSRCYSKTSYYAKQGIKNFLSRKDLKYLWFRDKAYFMKRPSIDRKNSKGNYTLENCRYIELSENCSRAHKGCIPWDKGIKRPPFSNEWKANMSKARKKSWEKRKNARLVCC